MGVCIKNPWQVWRKDEWKDEWMNKLDQIPNIIYRFHNVCQSQKFKKTVGARIHVTIRSKMAMTMVTLSCQYCGKYCCYSHNSWIFYCSRNTQVTFCGETPRISFPDYKHWLLVNAWPIKALKGTVVNMTLSALYG